MTRSLPRGVGAALAALALVVSLGGVGVREGAAATRTDADYRAAVQSAAAAVAAARSAAPDPQAAVDLAAELRRLLPDGEAVTLGERTVTVSDPMLASLISELERAGSGESRGATLDSLEKHLASLDSAVAAPDGTVAYDEALLRELLAQQVLPAASTAPNVIQQWLDRILAVIGEWLAGTRSTPEGATALLALEIAVMAALAAAALWLVWLGVGAVRRASARREKAGLSGGGAAVVEAAEGLPDDPGAYSDALAAEGRFREAVRALFGGAARSLAERGFVSRARTRTTAELLAEVAPAAPDVLRPMTSLSRTFESAWYGHRDPGAQGFEAARDSYREVVVPAPSAPMVPDPAPADGGDAS